MPPLRNLGSGRNAGADRQHGTVHLNLLDAAKVAVRSAKRLLDREGSYGLDRPFLMPDLTDDQLQRGSWEEPEGWSRQGERHKAYAT